jgi:TonB family protein
VVAPKQLSMPKPYYPNAAKRMNNPGAAVNLKILVDEHGRVLEATPIGTQAGLGFEESAIEAAKRAVYQPATKEGVPVKFWTTLHVIFPAGGR